MVQSKKFTRPVFLPPFFSSISAAIAGSMAAVMLEKNQLHTIL
jgi:hypothetical protein